LEIQSVRFLSLSIFSWHCIHRSSIRTYQRTASAAVVRYVILYGGPKSDAGVVSGRRRRLLDRYGFRFSTKL
jgi:hypothetical protein